MTELELQLKIWKELAITKQMLMDAAAKALKLDPECDPGELQEALEAAIKRAREADSDVKEAQERADSAIAAMERKLAAGEKALTEAEAARAELLANQQRLEEQASGERARTAQEVAKVKQQLAEKERELKAINTALADTPQNVLKKLKALKKDKKDESDARKRVETTAAALRKDKAKLEQELKATKPALEGAAELATRYRELHALCGSLHEQLQPLVEDAQGLPPVPALESELLEKLEKLGAQEG